MTAIPKTPRLLIVPLGLALSIFFAISYLLCILYGLMFSDQGFHQTLLPMVLPGFTWPLAWPGFFLGLIWSVALGWYVATAFTPLFNFFMARCR